MALLLRVGVELQDGMPRAEVTTSETTQAKSTGYRQFLTLRVGREMIAVSLDRIHGYRPAWC